MSTNLAMVIFLALTSWTSNSHFRPDQQMLVHGLADGFTHGNQSDGYPCAATTQDECVASEGISSGGIRVRVRRRCKPVAAEAQMTFF